MDISGTLGDDLIDGTAGNDTILANAGNDTVKAGAGNDRINGGTGNDTLNGEDGDDIFVEDQITSQTDVFNGGAGYDTIELWGVPNPVITGLGSLSPHSLTSLTSVERMVFKSEIGQYVSASISLSMLSSSGLTDVVGGAGRDYIMFTSNTSGNFTMPQVNLSSWDAVPVTLSGTQSDFLMLASSAPAGAQVTLNAVANLNAIQFLNGGAGDDTLNGSANADVLIGNNGGTDRLFGNGGNDVLTISNYAIPNGPGSFGPPTNFTGAGSLYDGGSGTDALSIGGYVDFRGSILNIEGVMLQPGFTPPVANTTRQDAAVLVLDSAHLAMLPTDAFFQGTGTVTINLDDGRSFDGRQFVVDPAQPIKFEIIAGSGDNISIIGTSTNDYIEFGNGRQTATGGAGADIFMLGGGVQTITDFTIGVDKVDFTNMGIVLPSRLPDFMTQGPNGAVFAGDSGGVHYEYTFQGVNLSSLSKSDGIFGDNSPGLQAGSAQPDILFGGTGADELRGGAGNDRLYSGGFNNNGADRLYGDDGDDTLIIDGATVSGGVYDGGAGTDTLLLRGNDAATLLPGGQTASTILLIPSPSSGAFTGIERIQFDSKGDEVLTPVIALNDVRNGGVVSVTGGAGTDNLVLLINAPGTFTLPTLTWNNWDNSANGDSVALFTPAQFTNSVTLNALESFTGRQNLIGGGGNDILNGSTRADGLSGGAGADTLNGGGGEDHLDGGAGGDTLNGGDGFTWADYMSAKAGVSAYLTWEAGGAGDAAGDRFTGIEGLGGSAFADVLSGNDLDNTLLGNDGNDWLQGLAGNDTLTGGEGNDVLSGGLGYDRLDGGSGVDVASYREAREFSYSLSAWGARPILVDGQSYGVLVDADAPGNNFGEAGGDTLSNIENIWGSRFDDVIRGADGVGGQVYGFEGNDNLDGRGGNDVFYGGTGSDTITGGTGADDFFFLSYYDHTNAYGTVEPNEGGDKITDFEHGVDHITLSRYWFGFGNIGGPAAALTSAHADFITGSSTATSARPTLFWDAAAHTLSFDPDGTGTGQSVLMATLQAGVTLTLSDIWTA